MKSIEFPPGRPQYSATNLTLTCVANVDGSPACYAVTAEALEDHFGARSYLQEDLLLALETHRDAIEDMARALFKLTDSHNIVLRSGHFPLRHVGRATLRAAPSRRCPAPHAHLRSRLRWQATQHCAVGCACSRKKGIASPQSTHRP